MSRVIHTIHKRGVLDNSNVEITAKYRQRRALSETTTYCSRAKQKSNAYSLMYIFEFMKSRKVYYAMMLLLNRA